MKIAASTTFSTTGYAEYAHRVIDSFIEHWDDSIDLYAYYDAIPDGGWRATASNVHYLPFEDPDLIAFKERNIDNPEQAGNGTNKDFLRDGIRFSHKVFAYIDTAMNKGADIAIWLDGDVITHEDVNEATVFRWLDGKMAGALLRPWIYTETGFHVFDMRFPQAAQFMQQWRMQYTTDAIWNLPWDPNNRNKLGYTDCHTYDAVRSQFPAELWNDLSPNLQHPHPFVNGILGEHMDHTKGPRKAEGRSRKSDIVVQRTESYWSKQ
jgi:hypothetical protein